MWVNIGHCHVKRRRQPLKSNPWITTYPLGHWPFGILCPLLIPLKLITPKVSSLKWQTFVISGSWIFLKLYYKEDENFKKKAYLSYFWVLRNQECPSFNWVFPE